MRDDEILKVLKHIFERSVPFDVGFDSDENVPSMTVRMDKVVFH